MKKIHSLLVLVALLAMLSGRAVGQTYSTGQFNYEINQLGSETYAYITGLSTISSSVTNITIPGSIEHTNGVSYLTVIAPNAFKGCTQLTDVTVSYGCRVIFSNAFNLCVSLKTLRLPSSLTALYPLMVNGAAQNGLTVYSALSPATTTHDGAWSGIPKTKSHFYTYCEDVRSAFASDSKYYNNFGDISVESAPQYCLDYMNTRGQKQCYVVTKPSTATTDGEMMLIGTKEEAGKAVEVSVGETGYMFADYKVTGRKTYVTRVMAGAYLQRGATTFTCSSSRLTEIGKDAFRRCASLQSVDIDAPQGVIGMGAFCECPQLKTVTVNTREIGDYAFWDCSGLDDLTLGEGVESIDGYAFSDCTSVTELHLPASLKILKSYRVDEPLASYYSWGGMREMANLKKVTVADGNTEFSSHDNILYTKSKTMMLFCPSNIDIIPTFPETLLDIKHSALYAIRNTKWKVLEIPFGVKYIRSHAINSPFFEYIKTPSTAYVEPKGILFTYDTNCHHEATVSLGKATYSFTDNNLLDFHFNPGRLYVPAGDHAPSTLSGHAALKRLFGNYYDDADINITYGAFDVLTEDGIPLLLDKDTKTARVVYGRFDKDYTKQLTGDIVIPDTYTYRGYTYTVTAIDMHAFEGNQNITSITIPSTVTSFIGTASTQYEGAEEDGSQFKTCTGLRTVRLPKSITTIPNYCFFGNKHSEMRLPYGIERIGYKAFASNAELISLFVPSSVKERGSVDQTFVDKCVKLNNLYMNTAPDAVLFSGSSFFPEVKASCRLYVPVGKYNSFYNVQGWQHFNTIKAGSYDFSYPGGGVYSVKSMGNGSNPGQVVKVYNRDDDGSFNSGGIGVPINIPETVSDGWGRSFTVVELGDSCMAGSFGSTSVTIPATVRQIGSQAMKDMTSLQKVTTKMTTLPVMGSNVWENVNQANVQLFYPEGMYEDYSTASQWKEFYMEEPLIVYDLTVNETKVTNKNRSDIPITSGKATYEPLLRRLTLEDAVIDCAALGEECRPIVSGIDNMTIRFVGDCRITGSCTSAIMLLGSYNRIEVTGHTVIEAKYDLTGNVADGYSLDGIISEGIVSLTGGGKLTISVDCDGIYTRGYTFYVTNTTLEVESRDRVAFLNGHLDLSLDEGHTVAFKGRGGAMTQSLYDYSGSCVFLTPADARYEYFAGGFVDSSGEIIKNEWVVIGSQHTPTTIEYAAGSSTAEGDLQSPTYNLQGQRVGKGYQGIIIRNGKKMKN